MIDQRTASNSRASRITGHDLASSLVHLHLVNSPPLFPKKSSPSQVKLRGMNEREKKQLHLSSLLYIRKENVVKDM